jgi:hypothetical protein
MKVEKKLETFYILSYLLTETSPENLAIWMVFLSKTGEFG